VSSLVRPTTLPFSGVVPSVSEDQVRCNGGMGTPFRFLGDLRTTGRIQVGHAPADDEYATAIVRRSPTRVRVRGCAFARNEYSRTAASTGSPYSLRWARLCMSRPQSYCRRVHDRAPLRRLH